MTLRSIMQMKESDTKGYMLYEFINITLWKKESLRTENISMVVRVRQKKGLTTKGQE